MRREVKIHNPTVNKLLKQKEQLVLEGRDNTFRALLAQALEFETNYTNAEISNLVAQIKKEKDLVEYREKMEKERNKKALKVQQIQDKIIPLIYKEVELNEDEDLEGIEAIEANQIKVTVLDEVEFYRENRRKRKEQEKGV